LFKIRDLEENAELIELLGFEPVSLLNKKGGWLIKVVWTS